jgi:hypothetical protein
MIFLLKSQKQTIRSLLLISFQILDFCFQSVKATSQDELDIEKDVKHVMNLSTQWQEENRQLNMTPEEVREIARDVVKMNKK